MDNIKKLIKSVVPPWLMKFIRKRLDNFSKTPPLLQKIFFPSYLPRIVAFDEAYPQLTKIQLSPARKVSTPEVLNMPFREGAAYLKHAEYAVPEDFATIIPNGLFSAKDNVVLTESKSVIQESSTAGEMKYFHQRSFYSSKLIIVPGYGTPLRSRFYKSYYHRIVDQLPRLLAIKNTFKNKPFEIKLLCPGGLSKVESFLLSKIGFENCQPFSLNEDNLYCIENLIFSSLKTKPLSGYIPSAYVDELRSLFFPKRLSKRNRRLLISREKAQYRIIENQDELLNAISRYGFEKIILENLSFQEQIELFYDAEAIISPHGGGLANIIFSPSLCVIELFASPTIAPHYYYLSKSLGHQYRYWCSPNKFNDLNEKTFLVEVRDVLVLMKKLKII